MWMPCLQRLIHLVGGFNPSDKIMDFVNGFRMTSHMKWKIKFHGLKPPTRHVLWRPPEVGLDSPHGGLFPQQKSHGRETSCGKPKSLNHPQKLTINGKHM